MRTAAYVDIEDIHSTKSEKVLAFVLALFIVIGGIWAYQEIDDYVGDSIGYAEPGLDPEDRAAVTRHEQAVNRALQAQEAVRRARDQLELRREAYRTALDAGRPAENLEREYLAAQAAFDEAERARQVAVAERAATRPAAEAILREQSHEFEDRENRRTLYSFLFRLLLVLALLTAAFAALARIRARSSRYLPLALAFVGAAALIAFVMAGDYITDYVDPLDFGPLLLSLFGIGLTLAGFFALQRYLARRIPPRRVRKHECPFCGYPVRENERCEGCGRQVVAECSNCAQPRRVGTLHCGVCGHA